MFYRVIQKKGKKVELEFPFNRFPFFSDHLVYDSIQPKTYYKWMEHGCDKNVDSEWICLAYVLSLDSRVKKSVRRERDWQLDRETE